MPRWLSSPKPILLGALALTLALVVACGSAAPAAPEIVEVEVERVVEKEVIREVPQEVVVEKEVVREVPVEVVRTQEVLREVPRETVVEKTVIATPTPIPEQMEQVEAKVTRVIYALGEVQETNRHWTVGRPSYYQFDPYSETLIGLDATTNERIPRLAKSWEFTPDGRTWTFQLEENVPFHFDYGNFTSADAIAALDRILGDDSQVSARSFFDDATYEAQGDNAFQIVFPSISLDTPSILSRGFGGGEIMMLSKRQFDEVGIDGFDEQPAGTGSYQYGGREQGQSIWFEKAPQPHWRGENPDFQEVELRWVREDLTRLAALLTGEIHIAALSRELQLEAGRRGMMPAAAGVPTNYLTMFLGGQYYAAYQEDYDPSVPWAAADTGKLVRQAMNKAIDRAEMLDHVLKGQGELMLLTQYHPVLGTWNDQWEADWEELYGYDPDRARALLSEAGYGPDNPAEISMKVMNIFGFPESADLMQSIGVMFADVGVDVSYEEWEFGNYYSSWTKKEPDSVGFWISPPSYKTVYAQLSLFNRSSGAIHFFETPELDELFKELGDTVPVDERSSIQNEMGEIIFTEYGYLPLFYIFIEFVANPEIIDTWEFPGSDGANYGHFDLIRACRSASPCF